MFDIGFWELGLIGIVALLVVGPERMPAMIRTVGQWAGHLQRLARDLRREIELEAEAEDYKALQADFLAEDRRLKEAARAKVLEDPSIEDSGDVPEPTDDTVDDATREKVPDQTT